MVEHPSRLAATSKEHLVRVEGSINNNPTTSGRETLFGKKWYSQLAKQHLHWLFCASRMPLYRLARLKILEISSVDRSSIDMRLFPFMERLNMFLRWNRQSKAATTPNEPTISAFVVVVLICINKWKRFGQSGDTHLLELHASISNCMQYLADCPFSFACLTVKR